MGFDQCRYDGAMIHDEFIDQLKPFVEFRTVCPELAIGLGVPRDPIRIIKQENRLRLIQPASGREISEEMNAFSTGFLLSLSAIDGFILKSRSPSCGIDNVDMFSSVENQNPIEKGRGFFARAIYEHFPHLPTADECHLKNQIIRENFLKSIKVVLR